MPTVEALDPALILDEWINRVQNFPEEIRFLQDEIADKDRQYDRLVREIDERDARIQRWIKNNGSHVVNPKEDELRATIRANFIQAEQLANDKLALMQKLQQITDKHVRQLDAQIKMLYDRNEPGFTDPDELPSLLRTSAANQRSSTPVIKPISATNPVTSALNTIVNNASQSSVRAPAAQVRNSQAQQHGSASAPATPAASMIMNRPAREGSVGPVPKRGPRSNSGLGNLPATSSGLARHSSLGPGTPKAHQAANGIPRAGSAGPRASSKGSGTGRKAGTPSSTGGRNKKGTSAGGAGGATSGGGSNKSGLHRVKRAAAKNSPTSTADSELSDAESGSGEESDARTTNGRGTPALSRAGSSANLASATIGDLHSPAHNQSESNHSPRHGGGTNGNGAGGSGCGGGNGSSGAGGRAGSSGPGLHPKIKNSHHTDEDDAMDLDEDDAGDDRKYCLCQNVSFGNMVACDNDKCPYEWFHWGCVGLKSEPNGTWYCPNCIESMKKKGKVPT